MGSGQNGQLTFIDLLSMMSFLIGLMNLEENLTQGDKQDLMTEFDTKASALLSEIHEHLADQDRKLTEIIALLERSENSWQV